MRMGYLGPGTSENGTKPRHRNMRSEAVFGTSVTPANSATSSDAKAYDRSAAQRAQHVDVVVVPFASLSKATRRGLDRAAGAYGEYLGLEARVSVADV